MCREEGKGLPPGETQAPPSAAVRASGHGSGTTMALCGQLTCDHPLQGDTGGPLACYWLDMWIQVGVLSWGAASGHIDYPGVYTQVTTYSSWIHQRIPLEP